MTAFKVDENLPVEVAQILTEAGHDAVTVPAQKMKGKGDPRLAIVCQQECRAIVTLDLDFGDIRAYPPASYSGIVVLRLWRQDKPRILSVLRRLLTTLQQETLAGKLWIVEESRIRIRDGE